MANKINKFTTFPKSIMLSIVWTKYDPITFKLKKINDIFKFPLQINFEIFKKDYNELKKYIEEEVTAN